MGLQGDFAKLTTLRARIKELATPATREQLHAVMGAQAVSLVKLGFRSGVDPYGVQWLPLKSRKGKPLLDTGRLRNSFSAQATPDGFRVGTNVVYAPHHQYGTGGRKAASSRSMPTDDRGRFMSKKAAGVARGRKVQALFHSFKRLNFQAGSGKIPARMMLPTTEGGLGTWRQPLADTAKRFIAKLLRGK